MRALEPKVLSLITNEGQSTTQITKQIYTERWKIGTNRNNIFKVHESLEKDGKVESKLVRIDVNSPPAKLWVLPGGTFPEGIDTPTMPERILAVLGNEPMRIDRIYAACFPDGGDARTMKQLNKSLNKMRARGAVVRCGDELTEDRIRLSCWRLGESE